MDKKTRHPPGLFFRYDFEPIAVTISDTRMPFRQFLVRLINIIGGLVICTAWVYKIVEPTVARVFGKGQNSQPRSMLDKPHRGD
jgi:hypothetical protein